MKTCKQCSRAMDDSFTICPYCGFSVNDAQPQPEQQPDFNTQREQTFYREPDSYAQPNQGQPFTPYGQPQQNANGNTGYTPEPRPQRSAYIAGILAIIGGMFGLHNFYLDNTKRGMIQLAVTVVGFFLTFGIASIAMAVWAITEGLKILKGEINTDGTGALIKMSW